MPPRLDQERGKGSLGSLARVRIHSEHSIRFCPIMYFDSGVHETEEHGLGMEESCRVEMSEMGFEARKSHR